MAELVQLGGTIIGGSLFGPVGAALGGAIGGLVGKELFPGPAINGPRIDTFRATGSAVGTPIIRGYGNNRLAGQLIWFGRVRERKNTKKVGGIGGFGGQKVNNFEYYATFAVGLQEGDDVCLRRIRINGRTWWEDPGYANGNADYLDQQARLLEFGPSALTADELEEYNATALKVAASQGRNEYFTFYSGTSNQSVDPTIAGYLGDHAPAYRDLAYVVFSELPVTEYGGGLPLIEFDTVSGPTQVEQTVQLWMSQVMYPWLSGTDPRHPDNAHQYKYVKQAVATDSEYVGSDWRDSLGAALADFTADTGFSASLPSQLMGWSVRSNSEQYSWEMRPYGGEDMPDRQVLNLHFNDQSPSNGFYQELTAGGLEDTQEDCRSVDSVLNVDTGDTVWWGDRTEFDVVDTDGGGMIGLYYLSTSVDSTEISPRGRNNNNCATLTPNTCKLKCIPDVIIQVRRVQQCPPPVCDDKAPLPENPDYCVDEDRNIYPETTFVSTGGDFLQLAPYETNTVGGITYVTQLPVGPVLNLDYAPHVGRNTSDWWLPFYNDAVAAGLVDGGWTFDATGEGGPGTYPRTVTTACQADLAQPAFCEAAAVLVSDVIEAETTRCAPLSASDLDTSLVTDSIWGLKFESAPTGRDAIEQLRTFSFLDVVDGPQLKFVPRGLPAVATLTTDDLAAHEYGAQRPPALEVTRVDDIQLPREVRVSYIDIDADLQPGQQYDRRLVTDAVKVQQIDLGIAMDADDGKRIATVSLYDQWAARKALEFKLGPRWLMLEPTDCIEIPDLDGTTRVRIDQDDLALPGLRTLQGVRDEISLYGRTATGATPQIPDSSEDTPVVQGPATAIVLDLPYMGIGDDDAGYWVAFYGVFDAWQSAEGFRSLDAGTTYDSVVESGSATAGVVITPYDGAEITVQVYGGELLSATAAAVAAGTNRFAIGAPGRWVIGAFQTASQDSDGNYVLTDLTMGQFNTEWAIDSSSSPSEFLGVAGDSFVMLETAARVSEEDSIVGDTVLFRPVTAGTLFANGTDQTFIARGNSRGFITGFGTTTPPAHSEGATYVVGAGATGEWAGFDDYIVHDAEDDWFFEFPTDGRQVRTTAGLVYTYSSSSDGGWSLTSETGLQDGPAGDVEISGGGTVITITRGLAPYVRGAGWDNSTDAIVAADCNEVNVFCPTAGAITRWTLLTEGGTGSCEVDVWKNAYGSGAPSVANSIVSSGKPSITSGTRAQSAPTGWTTTTVNAADVLTFKLDSSSSFTSLNLMLEITPT